MSDLNKLMEKLKTNKDVKVEEVKPVPKQEAQIKSKPLDQVTNKDLDNLKLETYDPDEDEDEDDEDLDDGSDDVDLGVDDEANDEVTPQETEGLKSSPVEHEVALLQNNGIFRRELIITLKEFVDVHKVNTQALLDLKDLLGGVNGKKTNK